LSGEGEDLLDLEFPLLALAPAKVARVTAAAVSFMLIIFR
jgi:hypothetical protein